ncbi:MAG: hypothetical protein ACRDHW_04255 [Ktedonobacteraceae bacterium]
MQTSNNKDKKRADAQPEVELSETWQVLLGKNGSGETQTARIDPTAQVQPLSSDPWNALLNARGMQPVDLQKVRAQDLRALANNDPDIEQALNIMREATGQLPESPEKS